MYAFVGSRDHGLFVRSFVRSFIQAGRQAGRDRVFFYSSRRRTPWHVDMYVRVHISFRGHVGSTAENT